VLLRRLHHFHLYDTNDIGAYAIVAAQSGALTPVFFPHGIERGDVLPQRPEDFRPSMFSAM